MSAYRIEFKELGRENKSGFKLIEQLNHDELRGVIRPYLLSHDLLFPDLCEGEWGSIFAGFNVVGKIRFLKLDESNQQEYTECACCDTEVIIEDATTCCVCGVWFCQDCIRENAIGEDVCYQCSEE